MQTYLQISATLFAIIGVGHLLRIARHWSAEIAGLSVPMWVSLVALVVTASLSFWALRLMRTLRQPA